MPEMYLLNKQVFIACNHKHLPYTLFIILVACMLKHHAVNPPVTHTTHITH